MYIFSIIVKGFCLNPFAKAHCFTEIIAGKIICFLEFFCFYILIKFAIVPDNDCTIFFDVLKKDKKISIFLLNKLLKKTSSCLLKDYIHKYFFKLKITP